MEDEKGGEAQVHRSAQGRNTNNNGPDKKSRHRNWSVTINNYTGEDITKWKATPGIYVFQEEAGDLSGTHHLQGLHRFENPMGFDAVKKLFPTAHLEVAKNVEALKQYCTKAQTNIGKIFTNDKNLQKKIDENRLEVLENLNDKLNSMLEEADEEYGEYIMQELYALFEEYSHLGLPKD